PLLGDDLHGGGDVLRAAQHRTPELVDHDPGERGRAGWRHRAETVAHHNLATGRPVPFPHRRLLGSRSMEVSVRDVAPLRRAILEWYAREHRNPPWRGTHDAYAVLVSEVMLQQTQANRVALRYPRFMARFPDVTALASASEAEILAEWSGLGYNRRAVALHRAAVEVATSGWPSDLRALQDLPGVGPYTARAIGSLAFGWPVGVVD